MSEIILGGTHGRTLAMDAAMANRHGIISGATGSGKTVTLQVLAEGFSRIGVPVFLADIKGDLSGIATSGSRSPKIDQRLTQIGISGFQPRGNPAIFWDLFAQNGHPVRATISDVGPLLLASLLELNDAQTGILYLRVEQSVANSQPIRKGVGTRRRARESIGEALIKSTARSIGSQLGRQLIRGLMGSLLGRGGRRR